MCASVVVHQRAEGGLEAAMRIRNVLMVAAIMWILAWSAAHASTESPIPPAVRDIVVQQSHLRAMVVAGRGPFKDLSTRERDALVKSQTRVLELLDGHGSIDELRVDEKVELFNHLETVKAAVTKSEENRQVCERKRLIGSNRYQLVCMNASEYRQQGEASRKALSSIVP
jgi:hypothetical protein